MVWLGLLAICVVFEPASAQIPREYDVKAAFLYHFGQFAEWPSDTFSSDSSPFIYGIIGDDPFGAALESIISSKTIQGRSLTLKRFRSIDELEFCHVLFIGSSESERLQEILDALQPWHVLTVGEMEQFAHQGGIINFVIEDNKVRFEINIEAANQAAVRINSKLLRLAMIIKTGS